MNTNYKILINVFCYLNKKWSVYLSDKFTVQVALKYKIKCS